MKNISPLKNIHIQGQYGNFENKNDKQILKIKEVKNLYIHQIVKFKNAETNFENLKIDNLNLPKTLKVSANDNTRILWIGPNNWLLTSSNNLNDKIQELFSANDFAVTDISHSRSIIEIEGNNVKEVIKKGSPFNIEELEKNCCANTIYNGITISIDSIEMNPFKLRVLSLRSFGESLYHSITDASLEYGYKSI